MHPQPLGAEAPWDALQATIRDACRNKQVVRWCGGHISCRGSEGPALTVLTNLPPEGRHTYMTLVAVLDKCFGMAHQTELNRMKL